MSQISTQAQFELALNEAAKRLSEKGTTVTPAQLEATLLRELGLSSREALFKTPWTPDIIIHHLLHVDFGTTGT